MSSETLLIAIKQDGIAAIEAVPVVGSSHGNDHERKSSDDGADQPLQREEVASNSHPDPSQRRRTRGSIPQCIGILFSWLWSALDEAVSRGRTKRQGIGEM
jgi:hypothetical protein